MHFGLFWNLVTCSLAGKLINKEQVLVEKITAREGLQFLEVIAVDILIYGLRRLRANKSPRPHAVKPIDPGSGMGVTVI